MKALVFAGIAASLMTLGTMTSASAQGGCGPYSHRGWDGFCRPNARPYGVYGYGYGWHRPFGYGYGWHRPWGGWHRW